MATTTSSYSPKEVSVIVGVDIIDNFTSVDVQRPNAKWDGSHDLKGNITFSEKGDARYGEIVIAVKQSSTDNASLSALYAAGETVPVIIKDNSGNSMHAIGSAKIDRNSNSEYSDTDGEREWTAKGNFTVDLDGGASNE